MSVYRVIGVESSPYAVKVRAVLRYRRIPHVWVSRMPQYYAQTAQVRPSIMPVVQFPDGAYRTDSTPIIRDFEALHPNTRSVIPDDETQAFVSDVIEDLADEWLTKCLFSYRFGSAIDARSGASWVMDDAHPDASTPALEQLTESFIERQVSRMPVVGCTKDNAPLFERFYLELLDVLETFVRHERFLFGSRPALADFGLYAQLNTMAVDPSAMKIMRARAPRTGHWVRRLDDASGVDGEWGAGLTPTAAALLELAGRYYLPFLAANRAALETGAEALEVTINGLPYRQQPYRYQAKCYDYLRTRYAALSAEAQGRVDSVLRATGCLEYLR